MAKKMPDMTFDPAHESQLHDIMRDVPQARASKMFGMPAYKVNGKLAVALFSKGMVAKLGAERVKELLSQGNADYIAFEPMEGRVWKDWLSIVNHFGDHKAILEEAVDYVVQETSG